ncbi:hypothetical protein PM116P2_00039 [Parabacteroides phage PM116P2]|nr:hypothetical protein PM116P1_00037 [Parabacteroides phage PM116P1]WAX17458.1 hypothetical protein PM116P2_00039 [Parabacteroides phage PM116P2]WAX17848.1 hypothetical protein PM708P2_00038 [Parabacteroides phage PM708P2]
MGRVFPFSPFLLYTQYKMGKICLSKISKNFLKDCSLKLNGITEMYLVALSDIESFTFQTDTGDSILATLTIVAGSKTVFVEGYKNAVKATQSIRSSDYQNALAQTITFPVYGAVNDAGVKAVLNGKYVAFTKGEDLTYRAYGLLGGLEASAADSDTNTNAGAITISLSTPEGLAGEYPVTVASSVWTLLQTNSLS